MSLSRTSIPRNATGRLRVASYTFSNWVISSGTARTTGPYR